MQLVHDRKLSMRVDSTQTAGARALARWIKFAVCTALVAAFIWGEMAADIQLMNSGTQIELAP